MAYSVGDTVVHSHHGAAIVESTERRELEGQTCEYLVLRMTHGDLTLFVPADTCHEVGIRDVVSGADVDRVFDILREKVGPQKGSWSRHFKANFEKLRSGDVFQVAEVVRNLAIRHANDELSAGERRMLSNAKQILLSELSVAIDEDVETTERMIEDVVLGSRDTVDA